MAESTTMSTPEAVTAATLLQGDFRTLMAGFPTGVAVVTTLGADGVPMGMTCSSVCSVSLEPPTLLVCMRNESPTLAMISTQRTFAVNLLHHAAQPIAELFASGVADRFDQVSWHTDLESGGPHLTAHAHSVADCSVTSIQRIGDHNVIVGEVTRVKCRERRRPLLYGLRRYFAWPSG